MIVVTPGRLKRAAALACLLVLAGLVTQLSARTDVSLRDTLKFAAEMARKGNWREARFRWEIASRQEPDNGRILNNLAVAMEALGKFDEARDLYDRSMAQANSDQRIEDNLRRFERFRRLLTFDDGEQPAAPRTAAREQAHEPRPGRGKGKGKGKGKGFRTSVALPMPAKLDLAEDQKLLVTSFLHEENVLLDLNRELVRFLRSEFRKRSKLEVLPITPPPAIPEQTLQDLIYNREFWRHLNREYGADLIVSGVIVYGRNDVSGFRDVDTVSQVTGQKIRQSQFVEQEEFRYELDILFIEGSTGELLLRDRLQRSAVFRGTNNDPITAFYELSESISGDVLAIVSPRTQADSRFVFKN